MINGSQNFKKYTAIDEGKGLDERDIKPLFIDAFIGKREQVNEKLSKVAIMDTTPDRLFERYDWTLSSPLPTAFTGETKYHQLQFSGIQVSVRQYKDGIFWTKEDELKYLGSRNIQQTAQRHGEHYAVIPWLMAEKALQDTTDTNYLPTALAGYDGDTLVNASSDTRFGVTYGNYYAGTGVTAEDTVEDDIIGGICRFPQMLDEITERPFWEGEVDNGKYYLLYGPALSAIIQKVFKRNFVLINGGTGGTTGTAGTRSNIIAMGGFQIELMFVGGMSGNSYYIIKDDTIRKPLILLHGTYDIPKMFMYGIGQGYKEMDDTLSKAVSFYDAWGVGIHTPQSIVKIYNA